MSRPPSASTTDFRRRIGKPEQDILVAAGEGDTTQGFYEVMAVYRHFYNQGLRPSMDLDNIMLIIPIGKAGRPKKDSSTS